MSTLLTSHDLKKVECWICGKWNSKKHISRHLKRHHMKTTGIKVNMAKQAKTGVLIEDKSKKQPIAEKRFQKQECKNCNSMILVKRLTEHEKFCTFIEKSPDGFDCKLCSCKTRSKISYMYQHIHRKHLNSENIINDRHSREKCEVCDETIPSYTFTKHFKACLFYSKFINKLSYGYHQCSICHRKRFKRSTLYNHIRTEHNITIDTFKDDSKENNENLGNAIGSNICKVCQESVEKSKWNKHSVLCKASSKYINERICSVCNIGFDSIFEIINHVKKEHMHLVLKETLNDTSMKTKKCEYCCEEFQGKAFETHLDKCMKYGEFFKKSESGYFCKLCSSKRTGRLKMYSHISRKHPIVIDSKKNNRNTLKTECEICKEMILTQVLSKHSSTCKLYAKFITRSANGFKCNLCPCQRIKRSKMYWHIREVHPNYINLKETETALAKKRCHLCEEMILSCQLENHQKPCKLYMEFISKSINGYKCKLCPFEKIQRDQVYEHIRLKHNKGIHLANSQENPKFNQEIQLETKCMSCKEMVNHRNLIRHLKACEIYSPFFKKDQNIYNCNLCRSNISSRGEMYKHIRKKHIDEISNEKNPIRSNSEGNIKSIYDLKNCQYCLEMVYKNDWDKHNELCIEASKYVDEQMCLICEVEFQIAVEALNHIKKDHLELIEIIEKQSEIIQRCQVKEKNNANMNRKDEKICSSDFNVNMNIQDRPEPVEVTTIFKCSLCFKKYLSASDVETHISSFHRIPIEIQKQGGISTKIIEEIL